MLVVTRHKALVEYLKEEGLVSNNAKAITHARPEDVIEQTVIGVLPHRLSCLTTSYTEVVMAVPAELRGKELTVEQVRELVIGLKTYSTKEGLAERCSMWNTFQRPHWIIEYRTLN